MSELSREDRVRYARQISLPEIGEAGQLRLAQARIESRHPVAAMYLERAGVGVVAAAGAGSSMHVEPGEPALSEAAAFLSGALSAVEAIKDALGVGAALVLPDGFQLGQEQGS